ncbi:MAG TPA: class I SAM-dependent methyltransferase [Deltaproteobacteria bacterium]|nr:class I SAM-dependent methyltransferase [Deltaproteobacteria bacterium]
MLPRLYTDLAPWWPLLSPPDAYAEDAQVVHALVEQALDRAPRSLLELGCGSGTLASHLPNTVELTLNDLSPEMVAVAADRNPTATTHCGDLRTLRLPRTFDAVLIHDALMYLGSRDDVEAALATAAAHLEPGGVLVLMPDFVEETFYPGTDAGGGEDPSGRAVRLLEWRWDRDPDDGRFEVEMALLLRDEQGSVRSVHEQHSMGLFSLEHWGQMIRAGGFTLLPVDLTQLPLEQGVGEVFVCMYGTP